MVSGRPAGEGVGLPWWGRYLSPHSFGCGICHGHGVRPEGWCAVRWLVAVPTILVVIYGWWWFPCHWFLWALPLHSSSPVHVLGFRAWFRVLGPCRGVWCPLVYDTQE